MPKFIEDDELASITPTKSTPPPAEEVVEEVAEEEEVSSVTVVASSDDDDDDADWGDEKIKSYSDGLDRLRPDKGSSVRFAILAKTDFPSAKLMKKAYTHFIDKKGTYQCLKTEDTPGECCRKLGEDSYLTLAALVLCYTNANKQGRYLPIEGTKSLPPIEWKIMYVQLGKTNYADIDGLPEEGSKVADIDIIMTHKNPNGKGGYKFTVGASQARWKKNPALVKEVTAAVAKFADGRKLAGKLGKKVNAAEMKLLLASLAAPAVDEANMDDIEGI
jgi:hypothetical protein